MDPENLAKALKTRARELGFPLVGITSPEPPDHLDVYQRWLDRGHHGEMQYMARPRARTARADPTFLMPDCRSILVLGALYEPAPADQPPDRTPGQVAAYAVGDDYHDVLIERLGRLSEYINDITEGEVSSRAYTDSGPILERELAQRAGLGWIGKNTMLINPQVGSYFFLAVLLLSIELPVDEPMRSDHCGSCTRCLEACPTACILPDRTIDASRCISYLTIELHGEIPLDLRKQMDDWIFGCDVCQQVCPWNNRFAESPADPAFQPRSHLEDPDIRSLLRLDTDRYQELLRGSPLKRAKLEGLLRNAAVAAGNSDLAELVPDLAALLYPGHDPAVRGHASWALGQIGGPAAAEHLEQALAVESDAQVRAELERALSLTRDSSR